MDCHLNSSRLLFLPGIVLCQQSLRNASLGTPDCILEILIIYWSYRYCVANVFDSAQRPKGPKCRLLSDRGDVRARISFCEWNDPRNLVRAQIMNVPPIFIQQIVQQSISCIRVRERDVRSPLKSSHYGIVNIPRTVGAPNNEHLPTDIIFIMTRRYPVHPYHELCFKSPTRLVFPPLLATREQGIDFVKEQYRGGHIGRHFKQRADHLFSFAVPLRGHGGRSTGKQDTFRLVCHGLDEHGLTGTRWAIEQDPLGRGSEPSVKVRSETRQDSGLLEGPLRGSEARYVAPLDLNVGGINIKI